MIIPKRERTVPGQRGLSFPFSLSVPEFPTALSLSFSLGGTHERS